MKTIFILLAIPITFAVSAQKRQTFQGPFKNGTAKFTFYQGSNMDTILTGTFQYSKTNGQSESGQNANNLKSGIWKYRFERDDYKIAFSGNYINDQKDGIWTFEFLEEGRAEKYLIKFKRDTIVGKLNWTGVTGEFDNHGRFINNWEVTDGRTIYKAVFKDNILINLEQRNLGSLLYGIYRPDTSGADFANPPAVNPNLIRKEFDLDWTFRKLSREFAVAHIYGIDRVSLAGINTSDNEKDIFFTGFFSDILDQLNEKIFNYASWDFFRELKLKVNPEFLYARSVASKPKKEFFKPDSYKQSFPNAIEDSLADERPAFKGGSPKFISLIENEYINSELVNGYAEVELIIDRKGHAYAFMIRTTGNVSDTELRRAIGALPPWTPGKKAGKLVDVRMMLPIYFTRD